MGKEEIVIVEGKRGGGHCDGCTNCTCGEQPQNEGTDGVGVVPSRGCMCRSRTTVTTESAKAVTES